MTIILLSNFVVIIALLLLLWAVSVLLKDVSIIDVFWGSGFIVIAWLTVANVEDISWQGLLLPGLVTIWGTRLTHHIGVRKLDEGEDKRYVQMREKRGNSFWWKSLYIVFLLQGALMWIVSLPLQTGIAHATGEFNILHVFGILLWGIGFFFEVIGDAQLVNFKSKPENHGKVLDRGLWRYTRHPNYFGDLTLWWGFYLMSIGSADHHWTIIGPIIMSVLLMYVSGVTMTEKSMKAEKPEYEEYVKKTNTFFPWFPKAV